LHGVDLAEVTTKCTSHLEFAFHLRVTTRLGLIYENRMLISCFDLRLDLTLHFINCISAANHRVMKVGHGELQERERENFDKNTLRGLNIEGTCIISEVFTHTSVFSVSAFPDVRIHPNACSKRIFQEYLFLPYPHKKARYCYIFLLTAPFSCKHDRNRT